MLQLPALPPSIRILTSDETERLRNLNFDLPTSVTNCVTCRGRKVFRWWDFKGDNPVDYECDCESQFILSRFLLNAGIEKHYQRLSWADATGVAKEAFPVIDDYIKNCDRYVSAGLGLVLFGKYGTGKTMLAVLLLKSVLSKGVDGYFTTFHTMLDLFTAGWKEDSAKVWFDQRIRNAGLLVLDDIGREYDGRNAVAESALDHVLRTRVAADRPTILTTNRTLEELATLYSGNAVSLLSECTISYEFKGEDYRPQLQERTRSEALEELTRPLTLT